MSTIIKVPVLDPATGQFVERLLTLEEWIAAIAATAGGGGGGGGGGVKSFNTRKDHVVSIFGDYSTNLIGNASANTLYTGLTTATQMFDLLAGRVSFSRRAVAVTAGTSPLALAALTTASTNISVASDNAANVVRVPAGLTVVADGFRMLRLFNDPGAGSVAAFVLAGAVAQSFNGLASNITVPLGGAVTLQLNADNSWQVVDFSNGSGAIAEATTDAVSCPSGIIAVSTATIPASFRGGRVRISFSASYAAVTAAGGLTAAYEIRVGATTVVGSQRIIEAQIAGTHVGAMSSEGVSAALAAGTHSITLRCAAIIPPGDTLDVTPQSSLTVEGW